LGPKPQHREPQRKAEGYGDGWDALQFRLYPKA
jgi:hypothetical protein